MEPLDLTVSPPRSPYTKLAGLCYAARLVDKIRASLPGGELAGFLPFTGLSRFWERWTHISPKDLAEVVASAGDEWTVVAWLEERAASLDKEAINQRFFALSVAELPEDWRPDLEAFYPAELRAKHTRFFDLLDADDARLFAASP